MRLKNWLLAGTGLGMLAFTATPILAQEALVAAYANYIVAEQSGDSTAVANARTALMEQCIVAGYGSIEECISVMAANPMGVPAEQAPAEPPPAEPPPAEPPPAVEQPPADQPVAPVEQPPAEQPAPPVEQPPAEPPAPAEPPPAEPPPQTEPAAPDPMVELQNRLDAELGAYQQALDMAAAGDLANAQPIADAAAANILALCTNAGYPSVDACIGGSLPPLPQPPAPAEPPPQEPTPDAVAPEPPPAEPPPPQQSVPEAADAGTQLQGAVQLYGQGIAQLQAGDATGQQAVDQALAQMAMICGSTDIGTIDQCLAQNGLALPQFQPQNPTTDTPVVSEGTVAPPPPTEPVPDALLDQPVTTEAVEPVPEGIQADDVAPLLDSIKDAIIGGTPTDALPPDMVTPPPTSDADAQVMITPANPPPTETGTQITPPDELFLRPATEQPGVEITPQTDGTGFVFQFNTELFFFNPDQERDRVWDENEDEIFYEELSRGRIKETIVRPNGVQIVTIRGRDGEILRRSRIMPDGREYVLAYYDDEEEEGQFTEYRDPGQDLPPLVLNIPARDYILDARDADEEEVADFFSQPPVEQVRRLYSIEEVKRSARIRDSVRRLEIGGLTFDSGKATISRSQVGALSNVANAMLELLDRNPAETFLIEGHTDAVGSEISNLALSDLRAATIARILTDFYGIPPENLVTQGYGERYLKIRTEAAERLNRRVQVRRITPLITLASN